MAADAALLLARAADPRVEHALDGRLPPVLARLERESSARMEEVVAAARLACGHGPPLLPAPNPPGFRPDLPAPTESWLHDIGLHELLGYAVRQGLFRTENRYTGRDRHRDYWFPGARRLPDALHGVGPEICRATTLELGWAPFVEIQMVHAISRANGLPLAAGPLDPRIPAFMQDLDRREAISQADILDNAYRLADHALPVPDPGDGDRPRTSTSARAQAALASPARPAPADHPGAAPPATAPPPAAPPGNAR
ncbi:hypothetical protein ABT263_21030 [Kitasatospora sp. NPDC001603]|uniref:hypothetical protein n=1 Tax=Kitasatospora sp. NPDC001603 TaxID=3154388 RepID=UPI003331157D